MCLFLRGPEPLLVGPGEPKATFRVGDEGYARADLIHGCRIPAGRESLPFPLQTGVMAEETRHLWGPSNTKMLHPTYSASHEDHVGVRAASRWVPSAPHFCYGLHPRIFKQMCLIF